MRSPFSMASVANTPLPWMGDRRAAIFFFGIAWFRATAGSGGLWPIPPARRGPALQCDSGNDAPEPGPVQRHAQAERDPEQRLQAAPHAPCDEDGRSEEHTSELQSLMRISYAVFCLKKKKKHSKKTQQLYTSLTSILHPKDQQ